MEQVIEHKELFEHDVSFEHPLVGTFYSHALFDIVKRNIQPNPVLDVYFHCIASASFSGSASNESPLHGGGLYLCRITVLR